MGSRKLRLHQKRSRHRKDHSELYRFHAHYLAGVSITMAIEIKQLLIKSNIVQRTGNEDLDLSEEHRLLKEEVLAECRRMIADFLREQGER